MRCGLCGFLIMKLQTALYHAVRSGTVTCNAVMPFCRKFWYDLYGLVNTPCGPTCENLNGRWSGGDKDQTQDFML